MNERPRRRGWRILAAILAAVVAAIGGLFLWIKSVESRRWAEMEAALRALEDEAAARPLEQPALRGEPVPGNAWEDYDRALKSMKELGSIAPVSNYLSRNPNADRDRVREVLRKQAPTLEAVRSGVRRATLDHPIDWRTVAGRGSLSFQYLVHLVVSQARMEAEEGRFADAARLLLDAGRLSADCGRNADLLSGLLSNACQVLVLDDLKGVVLTGKLSAEELREIADGLDVLDRSFPRFGDLLLNGALGAGWEMRNADSVGVYLKIYEPLYPQGMPHVSSWRFAFSERLMMKDAFEKELEWSRRIARADARSWADASRITREVDAERAASPNGIPRIVGRWLSADGYYSLGASFRERRAQLRLLRAAALFRAGGDVLESEDPFGGMLTHQLQDGRLMVWSAGRDARNDGGSGAWSPRAGKDIVLEVMR